MEEGRISDKSPKNHHQARTENTLKWQKKNGKKERSRPR